MIWWVVGMILAIGYTVFTHRSFAGKVSSEAVPETEGY
jgi:hypothetical protein